MSGVRDEQRFCEARVLDCSTCSGTGQITEEHSARILRGERLRRDRIRRRLSGREEARRLHITPLELNMLEHGKDGANVIYERVRERLG